MKKSIKYILCIIISGIVFTSAGAYAASVILSKDVSYDNTKSKMSSTNVQDALDEVYGKITDIKVHELDVSSSSEIITIDTKSTSFVRFVALFIPDDTTYEPSEIIYYSGRSNTKLYGHNAGNSTVNYPCTSANTMSSNTAVANNILITNIWLYGTISNGIVKVMTPNNSSVAKGKLYWWII